MFSVRGVCHARMRARVLRVFYPDFCRKLCTAGCRWLNDCALRVKGWWGKLYTNFSPAVDGGMPVREGRMTVG